MTTKKTTISTSFGITLKSLKDLVIVIMAFVGAWTLGTKGMDMITQGIYDHGPDGHFATMDRKLDQIELDLAEIDSTIDRMNARINNMMITDNKPNHNAEMFTDILDRLMEHGVTHDK